MASRRLALVGDCSNLLASKGNTRFLVQHGIPTWDQFHLATAPNLSQPTDWRFPGVINKSLDLLLLKSVKRFRDFLLILLCSILRLHLKKKKNSLESFSIYVISVFCSFLTVLLNLLVDGGTVFMKEENQIRPDSIIIRSHGPLLCSVCCCYYKW